MHLFPVEIIILNMRSILIYLTVFEWLYNSYLLDLLVNGDTVHTSIRQQTTNTKVKKINI